MAGAFIPKKCTAPTPEGVNAQCGPGTFVVLGDRSRFIDQQTMKLQVRRPRVIEREGQPYDLGLLGWAHMRADRSVCRVVARQLPCQRVVASMDCPCVVCRSGPRTSPPASCRARC